MKKVSFIAGSFIALISIFIGFILNLMSLQNSFVLVHGSLGFDFAITFACIIIMMFAWDVKKFLDGKKPNLKPKRAVLALLLSQSGFYSGCAILGIMVGGFFGILAGTKGILFHLYFTQTLISAGFAILLIIIGLIGEHFCKTTPPKEEL